MPDFSRLPNAEQAVISREKLVDYILSRAHPIGRFKAVFFARMGFQSDNWRTFEILPCANSIFLRARSW